MSAGSHFRECLGSRKPPCPRSHSIPKSHSIRAARPGRNESLGNPTCTWNPDLVTICVRWHWDAAFPGPSQVGRGILCGCEHEHIYKSNYSHICNRLKNGTTKDIHTLILQAVSATSYSCKGGIKEEGDTLLFSHRVMSDSLRPHGLQHSRPPCPSPTPSLLKLMSIESVMPSNHLILCHPLLLLPSIFPSIRVFPSESVLLIWWPKYWSFTFSVNPSNEYSGLISFRMDWYDLLAVQGLLRVFSNTTVWRHQFFSAQPFLLSNSHLYMNTGKTMSLTIWNFVGKVMSLLFNMLSRFVKAFLPRSKCLLISWLHSSSIVILEPKKIKSVTVSPSICHEVMEPNAMIFVIFWMLSFKPVFSLFFFTFIKRLFNSSSLSVTRVVSSAYLRLLIFLPAILIPACASSSPAFLMMYSAYKINKQGDNIQPWRTPFPTWNQSIVSCLVLTVASWPSYRFLRSQVKWSGIPISLRIFHSLLWSM